MNKKGFGKNRNTGSENKGKVEIKNPCRTCEKLNEGTRYHPESSCWFKIRDNEREKNNQKKYVNNSVIEAELIDDEEKNE